MTSRLYLRNLFLSRTYQWFCVKTCDTALKNTAGKRWPSVLRSTVKSRLCCSTAVCQFNCIPTLTRLVVEETNYTGNTTCVLFCIIKLELLPARDIKNSKKGNQKPFAEEGKSLPVSNGLVYYECNLNAK